MSIDKLFFRFVLEDVIPRTQRRQVHLSRVMHVVVRIPALNFIKHTERLLELILDESVLSLERHVEMKLRIGLYSLDLIN